MSHFGLLICLLSSSLPAIFAVVAVLRICCLSFDCSTIVATRYSSLSSHSLTPHPLWRSLPDRLFFWLRNLIEISTSLSRWLLHYLGLFNEAVTGTTHVSCAWPYFEICHFLAFRALASNFLLLLKSWHTLTLNAPMERLRHLFGFSLILVICTAKLSLLLVEACRTQFLSLTDAHYFAVGALGLTSEAERSAFEVELCLALLTFFALWLARGIHTVAKHCADIFVAPIANFSLATSQRTLSWVIRTTVGVLLDLVLHVAIWLLQCFDLVIDVSIFASTHTTVSIVAIGPVFDLIDKGAHFAPPLALLKWHLFLRWWQLRISISLPSLLISSSFSRNIFPSRELRCLVFLGALPGAFGVTISTAVKFNRFVIFLLTFQTSPDTSWQLFYLCLCRPLFLIVLIVYSLFIILLLLEAIVALFIRFLIESPTETFPIQ